MSEDSISVRRFVTALQEIKNQRCVWFSAGEGTGSVVMLDFGELEQRPRPLRNRSVPGVRRTHHGRIGLLIESAWRLDTKSSVLCGSTDSNCPDCDMVQGLEQLVSCTVKTVRLNLPALDLAVGFENGLRLRVFCDQTNLFDPSRQLDLAHWTRSLCGWAAGIGPS